MPATLDQAEGGTQNAAEEAALKKNSLDIDLDQSTILLERFERSIDLHQHQNIGGNDSNNETADDGGMTERKEQAGSKRPPAFMHQLAGNVIDGRDMICVEGVAQ